jgi:hypothetical protein
VLDDGLGDGDDDVLAGAVGVLNGKGHREVEDLAGLLDTELGGAVLAGAPGGADARDVGAEDPAIEETLERSARGGLERAADRSCPPSESGSRGRSRAGR